MSVRLEQEHTTRLREALTCVVGEALRKRSLVGIVRAALLRLRGTLVEDSPVFIPIHLRLEIGYRLLNIPIALRTVIHYCCLSRLASAVASTRQWFINTQHNHGSKEEDCGTFITLPRGNLLRIINRECKLNGTFEWGSRMN